MASSSSSSSTPQPKYDVFLSFRGEDTRDNFTSHLHYALCRKKIKTFIDDVGLKRGGEISPLLLKAIEESKISVIIFSKDYASSKWCLEELAKILECKQMNGQMVIPIFYHVNPSDVRKQTGSFKDSFVKHEKILKKNTEKIERWRTALTEASNISGWDSSVTKPEAKLIDEIVRDILKKLKNISTSSAIAEVLVGLNSRVEQVKSLLHIGLSDVRIIGIWGMGGIGKTTIAGVVFNQFSSQFEGFCFVANVREEAEKQGGLILLREHILSQILDEENLKVGTFDIPQYIQERLQSTKVFVVLDDVNNLRQLEFLAGGLNRFGPGSRIVITTRNKQVLRNYQVDDIYEVQKLNDNEALKLFCNYAFKQDHPSGDLMVLSNRVMEYAEGNPLALKVLGSSLYCKTKQEWISALNKLRRISNDEIHNVLKISYEGLDVEEKEIFLDIAYFFKGWDRDHATKILNGCYWSVHFGLSVLIDRSLITISDLNVLEMHDLLQEMGWEIVRKESLKDPGKRSRLCNHEDIYDVLKYNKGSDSVEGIFLDMTKITDVELTSGAFGNMSNLRLLRFYNLEPHEESVDISIQDINPSYADISKVHLPRGLKYLSDKLRYLYWDGCPIKTLPSKFIPENLVELNLSYSNVEQLWKGRKHASKLKIIDLNEARHLTEIPDLTDAKELEVVRLRNCKSIRNFPLISVSTKDLDLSGTAIEEIPTSVSKLVYLSRLDLSYCTKLKSLPEILEKLESLECLWLVGAPIKELPSFVEGLSSIRHLTLADCKALETLPSSFCNLTSLRDICFDDCSKLDKLPDNLGNLKSLEVLKASRAALSQLPSSIGALSSLKTLRLASCNLTEIPESLGYLSSLEELDLGGNNFESLPTSIKKLSHLLYLFLNDCSMLKLLPELPLCLESVEAVCCKQLQSLTDPSNLEELDEAELDIVSKCVRRSAFKSICFAFTNCVKLKQSKADSQLRTQHMAALSLRRCYRKESDIVAGVSFCLPGSEIPSWLSYQSSGSSITVALPQPSCNKRIIGFAVCAVITFEEGYYGPVPIVRVHYRFDKYKDDFLCSLSVSLPRTVLIESDHMVLGYCPFMDVELLKGDYTIASFEFTLLKKQTARSCNVKCCGVYPLYAQTKITQVATRNQDSGDIVVKEHNKIRKRHDEEEGAPHPKRICRERISATDMNSKVPSLHSRGGLSLSHCCTLVVGFVCGLCVLGLLEVLVFSRPA